MPKKSINPKIRLTPDAREDIRNILRWSEVNFGKPAAVRYRSLLQQALRDLERNPIRPGSIARFDLHLPWVRTYHISLSRNPLVTLALSIRAITSSIAHTLTAQSKLLASCTTRAI